ncbi:MAG: SH3 domain-containing protein [Balneolaceae bacterium]
MIRFYFLLLLFIVLQASPAVVQAQQQEFDKANELMKENRIEEAVSLYKSIEREGYRSGKLYFNMGLASLYQDSLGLAKYYLLQAADYADTREKANRSLHHVDEQLDRHSAVLPKLPWERFSDWLLSAFGVAGLLVIGILLLNLGVGTVIFSWFSDTASRWMKRAGYSAGTISFILICTSFFLQHHVNRFDTGVMIYDQSPVYEQPSDKAASISTAHEGYTMTVDRNESREREGWYYVRLQNGMYGWIEDRRIKTF